VIAIFSKTKELEIQTDEFCDKVADGVLAFRLGVLAYLEGDLPGFDEKKQQVSALESRGDELRREIQRRLYLETLLPESRADVLELLESADQILNACESAMWQFAIEKPPLEGEIAREMNELVEAVFACVEALMSGLRGFFKGQETLGDQMHKVVFFESEADKIGHRAMASIFESDIDLSYKNQLRHFILHIDNIADIAEDVADRLAIFALKRAI